MKLIITIEAGSHDMRSIHPDLENLVNGYMNVMKDLFLEDVNVTVDVESDPVHVPSLTSIRTDLPSGITVKEDRRDGVPFQWRIFNPWLATTVTTPGGRDRAIARLEKERADSDS